MAHNRAMWFRGIVSKAHQSRPPLRELRWGTSALLVIVALVGGGGIAIWVLWTLTSGLVAGVPADRAASLRLDAVKTGLTIAAGLGAAVTLLLALRRQSVTERAQLAHELDAEEQRTTALYVAAVEQLGSANAAVRLGGLYALDRLGQNNPKVRWTVIDVFCGYLRMPFTPPWSVLRGDAAASPARSAAETTVEPELEDERRQELEVRQTAQQLLAAHLYIKRDDIGHVEVQPRAGAYWRDYGGSRLNLNLRGATLVNFFLGERHPDNVDMSDAQFHGVTYLKGIHIYGNVLLDRAQFHGDVFASSGRIDGQALLRHVQFYGNARLEDIQFGGEANIAESQFHGDADLRGAKFRGAADFNGATFNQPIALDGSSALEFAPSDKVNGARRFKHIWPHGWTMADDSDDETGFKSIVCESA